MLLAAPLWAQEEPPLPDGLDQEEEPVLPAGLGGEEEAEEEPALPEGLSGDEEAPAKEEEKYETLFGDLPFDLSGFIEGRAGIRLQKDRYEKQKSLLEVRYQGSVEKEWEGILFKLTADFIDDHVTDRHEIRLEKGEGWLDIREGYVSFSPVSFMDLKMGRQTLTWGTGDLLFINDLFPKDWDSFFLGRHEEYLKAPSDAVKTSLFSDAANLDVVYTPRFDPDRYIDGRRISYWNDTLRRRAGRDAPVRAEVPNDWLDDEEVALRLYKNLEGNELALYGYRGYWKSPGGMDGMTGQAIFPALVVYGASARGSVWKGIGNVEVGYYDSVDDRRGERSNIRNSELRFLAGYEMEAAEEFTVGVQYNLERMMHFSDYRRALPPGTERADENRHVVTLRLTKLLMNQDLKLSLFNFYSPSDGDTYLRPNFQFTLEDNLTAEFGANVFIGKDDYTLFGQFERNTNLYGSLRFSF